MKFVVCHINRCNSRGHMMRARAKCLLEMAINLSLQNEYNIFAYWRSVFLMDLIYLKLWLWEENFCLDAHIFVAIILKLWWIISLKWQITVNRILLFVIVVVWLWMSEVRSHDLSSLWGIQIVERDSW